MEYYGYKKFKYGKNRACCKGLCITGPGLETFAVFPLTLILLSMNIYWYSFLTPFYFENLNKALPIITIILGVIDHYLILAITFKDPGYLLRHSKYEELKNRSDIKDYI